MKAKISDSWRHRLNSVTEREITTSKSKRDGGSDKAVAGLVSQFGVETVKAMSSKVYFNAPLQAYRSERACECSELQYCRHGLFLFHYYR